MRNIFLLFIFVLFSGLSISQTVETFTTPGSYTWICPANVTQVRVQCWGAGGGGGNGWKQVFNGGMYYYQNSTSGGGGGGGSYAESIINVTPDSTYFLFVGKGGIGASSSSVLNIAASGENSWFNSKNLYPINTSGVLAAGGSFAENGGNYGIGGQIQNSIGEIKFRGGNGGYRNVKVPGSGGSSAGSTSNGNNGGNLIITNPPLNGGFGGGSNSYKNGGNPGGGGSGSNLTQTSSGNGGNGQIILYYTPNCTSSKTVIYPYTNPSSSCGSFLLSATNASTELGLEYQWQMSLDSINWVNLPNNKQLNYTQITNKKITFYRVITKCFFGDTSVSNVIKHTLNDQFIQKGAISSDQNICQGNLPNSNLVLTNSIGSIQWQKTTDLNTWSDISNANDTILSPSTVGALNVTTYFRAKVSSSGCGTIYSDSIKLNVSPLSVKGTISPSQNICEGNSFADISLSGSVGSIQWQKSIDGLNWININNSDQIILSNKQIDTLKTTTDFRAIVTSGTCPSIVSNQTTVYLSYKILPGKLSESQILCKGDPIKSLKLTNYNNATNFQWQYNSNDTSNSSFWSGINSNNFDSLSQSQIGTFNTKRYFRCIYYNGICPAVTSNIVSIYIFSPSSVSQISSTQQICEEQIPENIKFTSFYGDSIHWENSIDKNNWNIYDSIKTNILTSSVIGPLNQNTYIRAFVKNSICPGVYTNIQTIQVDLKPKVGFLSANQTICTGSKPVNLSVQNYFGDNIEWLFSTPNNIKINKWTYYSSYNNDTLFGDKIGVLNEERYFQAVVYNGSCDGVVTEIDTIKISPISVSGTLTSNQTICQGTTPASVSITGNVGNISWEKSTDGSSWSTILNAPGDTLLGNKIGDLNTATYLRGVIKSGACQSVTSNNVLISVDSTSFGGYPSGNQSLCIGSTPTNVFVSKYRGKINWQTSSDGYYFTDVTNATSASLSLGSITSTKYYRTSAVNGVCPKMYSNSIQVVIAPNSSVGTLSSSQTICAGLLPNTINLSGAVGIISWHNLVWNPILNQSSLSLNNSAMGILNSKRYYKAIVKSGICPSVTSNTITVSVNPKPIVSGGVDKSICQNSPITLTGNGASSYSWDNGIQNGVSFTPTKSTLYTIIGTNTYGCKDTATVNISLLPQPYIQIINPNSSIICQNTMFGLNTNSTDVSSYQWRLNGVDIPNAKGSSINYNKTGNYSVLGISKDGCSQLSSVLPISFTPLPTINAGIDRSICSGQSIQLIATQATNYTWQNNLKNGDSVTPTATTNYIVSTTDNNGCSNSDTVMVTVNDKTYSETSLSSLGSYELNGQIYDQSGKYTQVLINKNGCDSIVTLNLVIESLGIESFEIPEIKIYPNPSVDGKIFIETTEEIKQIRIINTKGITLLILKEKEVDLGHFGRGVYFLEVSTMRATGITKVVY